MKYRKKPVVIEAVQWDGTNWFEIRETFGGDSVALTVEGTIFTLEGEMTASVGDWIIEGVQGELYPCKSDIFEATYDKEETT